MSEASIILVCSTSAEETIPLQFATLELTANRVLRYLQKIGIAKALQDEDSDFKEITFWHPIPRWYKEFDQTWEQVDHLELSDNAAMLLEDIENSACYDDWCQFPLEIEDEGCSAQGTELDVAAVSANSIVFRCYDSGGNAEVQTHAISVDDLKQYLAVLRELDDALLMGKSKHKPTARDERVIDVDRPV